MLRRRCAGPRCCGARRSTRQINRPHPLPLSQWARGECPHPLPLFQTAREECLHLRPRSHLPARGVFALPVRPKDCRPPHARPGTIAPRRRSSTRGDHRADRNRRAIRSSDGGPLPPTCAAHELRGIAELVRGFQRKGAEQSSAAGVKQTSVAHGYGLPVKRSPHPLPLSQRWTRGARSPHPLPLSQRWTSGVQCPHPRPSPKGRGESNALTPDPSPKGRGEFSSTIPRKAANAPRRTQGSA